MSNSRKLKVLPIQGNNEGLNSFCRLTWNSALYFLHGYLLAGRITPGMLNTTCDGRLDHLTLNLVHCKTDLEKTMVDLKELVTKRGDDEQIKIIDRLKQQLKHAEKKNHVLEVEKEHVDMEV